MTHLTRPPSFVWTPGVTLDEHALQRMEQAFPMPQAPMGEAWFLSETRRTFDDLMAHPRGQLPIKFMSVYWAGAAGVYPGFEDDVLRTLGQCLMRKELWAESEPVQRRVFGIRGTSRALVYWGSTSGDLSASLFFCLKYLEPERVEPWAQSLLDITAPAYRMRLLTWLWGAWPLLSAGLTNAQALEQARPRIGWDSSHCLGPANDEAAHPFLSAASTERFLHTVRRELTRDRALSWSASFDSDPELAEVEARLQVTAQVLNLVHP